MTQKLIRMGLVDLLLKSAACFIIAATLVGCETTTTTTSNTQTRRETPADQSNLRSTAPAVGSMNGNLSGIPRNTMGH